MVSVTLETAAKQIRGLTGRFDGVDQTVAGIEQRFDGIDGRFDRTPAATRSP